jgi:hypothetical protein
VSIGWSVTISTASRGAPEPVVGRHRRGLVVLVGDLDVGDVWTRPPDAELAERSHLLERDRAFPEQLEQREEPGHRRHRVRRVDDQRAEGGGVDPAQPVDDRGSLVADAHSGNVQVVERQHRRVPCDQGPRREDGELVRSERDQHVGEDGGEALLEPDGSRQPGRLRLHAGGDEQRRPLERSVLHEPGEEQVTRLQQRQVALVLDLGRGQQPDDLEVEQGRCDDEEAGRRVKVPFLAERLQVRDELIGHP